MTARLSLCVVLLLALAGCAGGGSEEGKRFGGAYGGISGGAVRGDK